MMSMMIDCSKEALKLYILACWSPTFSLSFLIAFHGREREGFDDELASTDCKGQILAKAVSGSSATFSSLCGDGEFQELHHTLRLVFSASRTTTLGKGIRGIHEVREGSQFDDAVAEEFCPAHQTGTSWVELQREGDEGCEFVGILPQESSERAYESEEFFRSAGCGRVERWAEDGRNDESVNAVGW